MFNRASVISWLFALTFVAQSSFATNLPDFAELAEKKQSIRGQYQYSS